jgi:hypothetical protein
MGDIVEDEVVEELDVYLDVEDAENLFFLQYPTISTSSSMFKGMGRDFRRDDVQVKPISKLFELDVHLDASRTNANFSLQRAMKFVSGEEGEDLERNFESTLRFTSSEMPCQAIQPMMGLRADGIVLLFLVVVLFGVPIRQTYSVAYQWWNVANETFTETCRICEGRDGWRFDRVDGANQSASACI